MKEAASEGVELMLSGLGTTTFPLHETGPVYAVKMIKDGSVVSTSGLAGNLRASLR